MLQKYLHRLYNTIFSRKHIEIVYLMVDDQPDEPMRIKGTLMFPDGSQLVFNEAIKLHDKQIKKTRYAYHYQDGSNNLIFRYDNAPHHPHIFTYPHHKHVGSAIEPSQNPDLGDVLSEIEGLLWNK